MGQLKEHMQIQHGDQLRRLPNDEATPACRVCGADHVGMLTSCFLVLRGNYVFPPEFGCETFILDPDIGITTYTLPNGSTAVVVKVVKGDDSAMVMHEDCVDLAITSVDTIDQQAEEDSWLGR